MITLATSSLIIPQDIAERIEHCPLCNSKNVDIVLHKSKCMASDSSEWPLPLNKVKCQKCGLIRNNYKIPSSILETHYDKSYQLAENNINMEPIIFIGNEQRPRSLVLFNWIIDELSKAGSMPKKILEIGCSDGLVLERFKEYGNDVDIYGIEPNQTARDVCKNKEINISGRYLDECDETEFDFIYSIAVFEHLEDPNKFLKDCNKKIKENGFLILIQPAQDICSHDIFFGDHVYHFSTSHIELFGNKHNFNQISYSFNKLLSPFSLHLFKKESSHTTYLRCSFKKCKQTPNFDSINYFQQKIKKIENFVQDEERVLIYGPGERYSLLKFNTSLFNKKKVFVDDNISRFEDSTLDNFFRFNEETCQRFSSISWIIFFNPSEDKQKVLNKYNIQFRVFT